MDLFFDSDMVNHLIKTNARRDRRFNFVIFVVWTAIIVDRWFGVKILVSAQLKSHLWCSWFCSKKGRRVSSGFHPWVVCGARGAVIIRGVRYNGTKLRVEILLQCVLHLPS